MNKLWIEHSYDDANDKRNDHDYSISVRDLFNYEYLDMLGLLETSWMIYPHDNNTRYGYPYNE